MQKWLLFFKPIQIAPSISKDDSINLPIAAYMALTVATGLWAIRQLGGEAIQKMGALLYQLNLASVIFLEPFSPLIGAAFIHWVAKKWMGLDGSLRRLILLFYYAGVGNAACRALLVITMQPAREAPGVPTQALEAASAPFPIFAVLITLAFGLYSIFVTLRLVMDNYAVALKTAVKLMIYSTLLMAASAVLLMLMILAAGGSGG